MIQSSCHNTHGALIEFPGVLLATFVPILKNLQNMHQLGQLPFRQWILPDRIGANGNMSLVLGSTTALCSGSTFHVLTECNTEELR